MANTTGLASFQESFIDEHSELAAISGWSLLAASPDCVKFLSLDGTLTFINENGRYILEVDDLQKILGKPWSALWPDKSIPVVEAAIAQAKSGATGRFTGFCPTMKGAPKWWDVAVSPVYDNGGKICGLLSISRDITTHKATEDALRVSGQHFRALADNIAQFAWMADASGYIFWYNQRWFEYTGTTLDEMKGWGWRSVHHPRHIDRVVAKWTSCLESGSFWEDTFPLRSADGEYRWFLSRAMPIRDDEGQVILWCGTNTDVTDQRNANARLRQLARLIELSHEAIVVRSLVNGVLLWNRGCEELYGYTFSEMAGRDPHEILKTDNALSTQQLDELLSTDGTWSGELVRTCKDGRRVWVECRKQVIRVDDEAIVLESDRDVTARKQADEIRNLMTGELNHRVKNTLAIVQSVATQTARGIRSIDEFIVKFSGRIQALSTAHNILTDTNWTRAQMRELVTSQLKIIAGDLDRVELKGQEISVPSQTALQLMLVLYELATNATKYGALSVPEGSISISWQKSETADDEFQLVWREVGGPPVGAPSERGFGLALVERSGRLPQLSTSLSFEPEGVVCVIGGKFDAAEVLAGRYFDPRRRTRAPQTS